MSKRPGIEICCFNLQSVLNAAKAGADRVELCDNYLEGGTSPSFATIKLAKEKSNIPIHVLVRPRGGDFCYSDLEFEVIKQDILLCKKLGVDGVAVGCLTMEGKVAIQKCLEIIELARPMSLTFHRAFDKVNNPFEALEDIIHLGFSRILTSGLQKNVLDGKNLLKQLVQKAGDEIIVMPGSGINSQNIIELHNQINAKEYHLTAKIFKSSLMKYTNQNVQFSDHPELNDNSLIEADLAEIQKVISALA